MEKIAVIIGGCVVVGGIVKFALEILAYVVVIKNFF